MSEYRYRWMVQHRGQPHRWYDLVIPNEWFWRVEKFWPLDGRFQWQQVTCSWSSTEAKAKKEALAAIERDAFPPPAPEIEWHEVVV